MQRCLSASLYWYVEKSLEDMLESYFLILKDEQMSLSDETVAAEVNQLITYMLELPMEFDNMSRQLSATVILSVIQRQIASTRACKHLLVTMMKRKLEIAAILKSDFLTMLEQVFSREVKKDEYLKPEKSVGAEEPETGKSLPMQDAGEDEDEFHPKRESRAMAEILIELYQKELVNATQVLVYLEQLSKKDTYYHTDILLFLLSRIGTSVEHKLNMGNGGGFILRNYSFSTPPAPSSSGCKATFDGIYKRLETLAPYAISTETQKMHQKVIQDRKAKTKLRTKKPRSREALKNGGMSRSLTEIMDNLGALSICDSSSVIVVPANGITEKELSTHL